MEEVDFQELLTNNTTPYKYLNLFYFVPKSQTIYTLYFVKEAGTNDANMAAGDIHSLLNNNCIEDGDIISLAREFVSYGWKISKTDRIETISNTIINEWAHRPWRRSRGIESLVKKGG